MKINLINDDCLEVMKEIPDNSIDLILCDPPYGTTACSWDSIIPLDLMWNELKRLIKYNGAIVLFCTQPFTSKLIVSNIEMFKYLWLWDKCRVGGFVNAKLKPLKLFEDIAVFSHSNTSNGSNNMKYYPQNLIKVNKITSSSTDKSQTGYYRKNNKKQYLQEYTNYPNQLLKFKLDKTRFHPTQKPIALMEYLIKTYTLENDIVLDFTMGSGTTGVACKNLNRNFIGIEKEKEYFDIAQKRINFTNCLAEFYD